jgi:hypothetical protein
MDHPFQSKKKELREVKRGIRICEDAVSLLSMTKEDHASLIARCETNIKNDTTRQIATRNSTNLGILLNEFSSISQYVAFSVPTQQQKKVWSLFVTTLTNHHRDAKELILCLECILIKLVDHIEKIAFIEEDGDSSSYSDYSDSGTDDSSAEGASQREKRLRSSPSNSDSGDSNTTKTTASH